jgi:hypothetical protein
MKILPIEIQNRALSHTLLAGKIDRDTEPCAITQKYMNFHKKNIEEREWR